MEYNGHVAALRRARSSEEPTSTHTSLGSLPSVPSADERSNDLFFATIVDDTRDPRHLVLTSRSNMQPEPSALPSEPLDVKAVLASVSTIRASFPPRPSAIDKREANHKTTVAAAQLSRIEEQLQALRISLASPSKDTLLDAERTFSELLEVFGSIRRTTSSLEQRKKSVGDYLERVQARIFELRNLYPKDMDSEPMFHDASKSHVVISLCVC